MKEDLASDIPVICFDERVKKDPKLQTLCKNKGLKPVMRGNSLYKLLNVAEPALSL
jgi:hypothetical protein